MLQKLTVFRNVIVLLQPSTSSCMDVWSVRHYVTHVKVKIISVCPIHCLVVYFAEVVFTTFLFCCSIYFINTCLDGFSLPNMTVIDLLIADRYVALSSNDKTGFRARELKSIHVDAIGCFVKFVIHKNHVNKHNAFNQVWCYIMCSHRIAHRCHVIISVADFVWSVQ